MRAAVALGAAAVSVLVVTPAMSSPPPALFSAPANFATGFNPNSVAVGDFNGDGKPDIAVANGGSAGSGISPEDGGVRVLLGDGSGSLGTPTSFAGHAELFSIAVDDLNGDGVSDLAAVNYGYSSSIFTLLGDGSGSFDTPMAYPEKYLDSLAIGDFNGDGKPDLAGTNFWANEVSIRLGDGSGALGEAGELAVDTLPVAIAVGDFNDDGKPDLAVTSEYSGNVSILLGTGSGSFDSATDFRAGEWPGYIVTGDFNSDGSLDLAIANRFTKHISILLGDGLGSFGAPTSYAVGNNPRSIAIGDFNLDGKPDLAVANERSNSISVLLGDGRGAFGKALNLAAGTRPSFAAVGDFNDDGRPDLAVVDEDGNESHGSLLINIKATTELTLASSRNPAPHGSSMNLTSTVKVLRPGSGIPTGAITILEDGDPLGTFSLQGNRRTVKYSLKGHPTGTDTFQAFYSGDSNYEPSQSTTLSQTITKAATELTLKGAATPTAMGATVNLNATVKAVAPGSGIPTGTIIFLEGGSQVASIPLSEGRRSVKCTLRGHLPGVADFHAIYSGDGNYEPSESAVLANIAIP